MTLNDINNKIKEAEKHMAALEKGLEAISRVRLLNFIVAVLGVIAYYRADAEAGLGIAAVAALVFIFYVQRFRKGKAVLEKVTVRRAVLERYRMRLTGEWKTLPEDGRDYLLTSHHKSEDLDLFGPGSLFQYLSVAHTDGGNRALARLLTKPNLKHIAARQASVKELLADDDFVIEFETLGHQPNRRKRESERKAEVELRKYATDENKDILAQAQLIGLLLPVLTIGSGIAAGFQVISPLVPLTLFMVQIGLSVLLSANIAKQKETMRLFEQRLSGMCERIELLSKQSFSSYYLEEMQKDIDDAAPAMAMLSRWVSLWSWRENLMLYFPLCGVLAWDFNCIAALDRWRRQYGQSFGRWLDWIGEVEALISLGTIGRIREDSTLAEISSSPSPFLEMEEATHPLLTPATAVANDYRQGAETVIITGSNMSGKSTFLRAVGLNAVLAYAGGVVCARRFVISPMHILTSMRVRDDVGEGISTFYGEILRVKEMADYAKRQEPLLVLIDEIFKGTNSADRIIGAEAAIRTLSKPWLMTLVTTHDFELCDLVEDENIIGRNEHFEEHYRGQEILFDYKIRPGRCRTANAQALMRLAGLLSDSETEGGEHVL